MRTVRRARDGELDAALDVWRAANPASELSANAGRRARDTFEAEAKPKPVSPYITYKISEVQIS
jgi:hypothetical protein